jgi:hypothetical protein
MKSILWTPSMKSVINNLPADELAGLRGTTAYFGTAETRNVDVICRALPWDEEVEDDDAEIWQDEYKYYED